MAERKPTFSWLLHKPLCFLGFGFGSGLSPVAPGTAGTLAALPLAFVLCLLGIDGWILLLLCIALFFWGIRICGYTERELGIQDYGGIVWDEIVAMLLVLSLIPFKWSWWLSMRVLTGCSGRPKRSTSSSCMALICCTVSQTARRL